MCEAALNMSDQKLKDQTMLLEMSRKDNVDMTRKYESQIKKERESRDNIQVLHLKIM